MFFEGATLDRWYLVAGGAAEGPCAEGEVFGGHLESLFGLVAAELVVFFFDHISEVFILRYRLRWLMLRITCLRLQTRRHRQPVPLPSLISLDFETFSSVRYRLLKGVPAAGVGPVECQGGEVGTQARVV